MNVTLVPTAILAPGACLLTKTSVGPFFDTGLDIDDVANTGRIYLAESTISDMAQQLGYAPPVAWHRANDELAVLRAAVAEKDELIAHLRASMNSLLAAGFTTPDPPIAGSPEGVLEWVWTKGDDHVAVRAREAFEAETQEPHPRQELLVALGQLIPPNTKEDPDVRRTDSVPV